MQSLSLVLSEVNSDSYFKSKPPHGMKADTSCFSVPWGLIYWLLVLVPVPMVFCSERTRKEKKCGFGEIVTKIWKKNPFSIKKWKGIFSNIEEKHSLSGSVSADFPQHCILSRWRRMSPAAITAACEEMVLSPPHVWMPFCSLPSPLCSFKAILSPQLPLIPETLGVAVIPQTFTLHTGSYLFHICWW